MVPITAIYLTVCRLRVWHFLLCPRNLERTKEINGSVFFPSNATIWILTSTTQLRFNLPVTKFPFNSSIF